MYFYDKPYDFYQIRQVIETEFFSEREFLNPITSTPTFLILKEPKIKNVEDAFDSILEQFADLNLLPFLRTPTLLELDMLGEAAEKGKYYSLLIVPKPQEEIQPENIKLNIILFVCTLISVFFAAWLYFIFLGADPLNMNTQFNSIFKLLPILIGYGLSILSILGLHELGHMAACRMHKTRTSWPYFIPLPMPPLGTMGAIIKQKGLVKNRNELFDIGLFGPLVGFLVTCIVLSVGLYLTEPITTADYVTFMNILYPYLPRELVELWVLVLLTTPQLPLMPIFYILDPIFFPGTITYNFYARSVAPILLPDVIIFFHPLAFAAWVGLLLTALNMLPFGQLDGGHVSRAVFGDVGFTINISGIPRRIELYKIIGLISLGIIFYISPVFGFIVLVLSRGISHPGPLNDVSPISKKRKFFFFIFLTIIALSFPLGTLWVFF
ncbi:MAG: site-2 protease family protein [Candidatus Helarchaeota archaeon]|nr:site-2 protease family protein [Candidatus Helarchaeota archaeon]